LEPVQKDGPAPNVYSDNQITDGNNALPTWLDFQVFLEGIQNCGETLRSAYNEVVGRMFNISRELEILRDKRWTLFEKLHNVLSQVINHSV
jgi:hypothetical protein